jgi:cation diffusion facilitator family transporter
MHNVLKRATNLALGANLFLFTLKLTVGIISNSMTLISEAVNSFTDIVSSVAIRYSVKISHLQADEDHQFGHGAAQPIATFIVSVLAWVLGISIVRESIIRLIDQPKIKIDFYVYSVLFITILMKIIMNRYQLHIGKKYDSPAVRAQAVDSINDVMASSIAVAGVLGAHYGYAQIDSIGGIAVAFFIFRSGYEIAKENINYLMGRAADKQLVGQMINSAHNVDGVKGINDLRSYYVGDKFHVEIHIEVDKNISTEASHDIGKNVEYAVGKLQSIQKVFVHIDPV